MAKNSYGWASPSSGTSNFKSTQAQGDFSQGSTQQDTGGMRREAETMQTGLARMTDSLSASRRDQGITNRNYGSRGTPEEMAQGRTMTQGSGIPANQQMPRPQQVDRGNIDAGRMSQMANSAQAWANADQNRNAAATNAAATGAPGAAKTRMGNAPAPNSPTMPQRTMPDRTMPDRSLQQRQWGDYGGGEEYGNLGQRFSDGGRYQFSATTNNQAPRTEAPERAPAMTNMGTPYTPRPFGTSQQAPIAQQNGYTDGRWNPPTDGSGQPIRPPRPTAGGSSGGFLNSQPPSQPPASGGAPVGGYGGGGGAPIGGGKAPIGGGGAAGFGTQGGSGGGMNRMGTREGGGAPTGGSGGIPQNFDINQFLSHFGPGGRFAVDQLHHGDRAPEMQYYANSVTPFLNFMGQGADREQNMAQFNATMAQQIVKDAHAMGIDTRGMDLQELAFQTGADQWGATFGEGQRQFNLGFGEEQRQFDNTTGFNYDRMNTEDRQARDLAQLQSQTTRRGQDVDTYGIEQRTGVDMRGQDVERYLGDRRVDSDIYLGDRRIDSDIYLGDRQYDTQRYLGDRQYDTQRYGIDTEAQVARQRMENELMQSRYNTFGRAQQPNFRMMGGWR